MRSLLKRVLFLSAHFPPDSTAGAHRARLLAPRLREHGWEPTVLTVDPRDLEGAQDSALLELVPRDLEVVRIRALPARLTRRLGVGDLGLRAWPSLLAAATRLHARRRFDAAFVTIYPTYPALIGALGRAFLRLPFVLDYQDPWVGAWGKTVGAAADGSADWKSRASRALAVPCEALTVHTAAGVTAVSRRTFDDVVARWPRLADKPFVELPIGYSLDDFSAARARVLLSRPPGVIEILHVGTLLPLAVEPLRELLAALALLRARNPALGARILLRFIGTSNQPLGDRALPPRVLPVAERLGVAAQVREQPARLPYLEALAAQQAADALLVLGSTEPHYTASKIFPVLLSQRPTLVSCHPASPVADYFRRAVAPEDGRLHAPGPDEPRQARIAALADHLDAVARRTVGPPPRHHLEALVEHEAGHLAARLAQLLSSVAR